MPIGFYGQIELNSKNAKKVASGVIGVDSLEKLFTHGLDLNKIYSKGNTLLHLAVLSKNVNLVEYLILKNVNLNTQNRNLDTPLSIALFPTERNDTIATMLIKSNANPNIVGKHGTTPLRSAIGIFNHGQSEYLFNLLIQHNADINFHCSECCDKSIFLYTAAYGTTSMLDTLIKRKVDVTHQDCKGNNAIIYAIRSEKIENIKYMFLLEPIVQLSENQKQNIYMNSIKTKNEEVILLVKEYLKK